MANITEDEFLARGFAVVECEATAIAFDTDPAGIDEDGREKVCFRSWWAGHARLADAAGVTLTFSWLALGGDRTYREAHEFVIGTDEGDPGFELAGATLVDDAGLPLSLEKREAVFFDLLDTLSWQTSVEALLPVPETVDIDLDDENVASMHIVQRDYAPDIRFVAELVASACSLSGPSTDAAGERLSMLALYRTAGGKWICERVSRALSASGHDRHDGAVCDTAAEVVAYFGHGPLARELYAESGFDAAMAECG